MADTYIVSNSDLTAVADAIRTKTGTTDQLTFPAGFTSAIETISRTSAIEGKGVTVQADTKLDGIKAGGGGNELLQWFGGSKFYTCTITPSYNVENITITPDDASILDSLKFLLIVPDVPKTNTQRVNIKAPMRAPSESYYMSSRMAFLTGSYRVSFSTNNSTYGVSGDTGEIDYKFDQSMGNIVADNGIIIDSSKGKITINSHVTSYVSSLFHGGSTYKVLLIG